MTAIDPSLAIPPLIAAVIIGGGLYAIAMSIGHLTRAVDHLGRIMYMLEENLRPDLDPEVELPSCPEYPPEDMEGER